MAYLNTSPQRTEARGWRRLYEAACRDRTPKRFYDDITEALLEGNIPDRRISLRAFFEEFVEDGHELAESFNPKNASSLNLLEAGSTVDTSAFANITGQIIYSRVLDAFNDPEFLWDKLFETIPTEFDGEKIAGIGRIGDQAEAVGEGNPYPLAGLSEEWVDTPTTTKRGLIVPVTKEAVFFDRTNLVLRRAGEAGRFLGINKEKRCLDVALGITTTYRRNGGAAQATYGNTHTNGDFDNLAASNALADWTNVEAAELLFDAITDPNTGEPIDVRPTQIVVPSALKHTARRIINATSIDTGVRNATTPVATSPNPLGDYEILCSQYVKDRTSSATTWFVGEFKRAFAYMENFPITVMQAAENSHDEFHRDIVAQFKASEMGAAACLEPRRVVKCTA